MKPYVQLAEARLPDGTLFTLHKHDGRFYLKNDGRELMSTALTHSEQMLAELGCAGIAEGMPGRPKHPKVLIGGLGMGFTLKRALEVVGSPATVEVAELMPEIIGWNRTFLVEHNGPILADERTRIYEGDLFHCLAKYPKGSLDALLVDIDDGPDMLITGGNSRLYTPAFFAKVRETLAPAACAAYWMAHPTPAFEKALVRAGFRVEAHPAKAHAKAKKPRHCIYVARRR
ncbi:spermine synthase [Luteolibacter marinus]|uniref:spermine synthase n=1 Tax=Luteolibacter marinus TaxID=2776705 RepID=UPI001866A8C4|nr:spermine synthase [Luteolibacter marinus]